MSYYRGDGGNYYRGDPFIGGLLAAGGKALIKGAKRTIGGIKNAGARAARRVMQRSPEMPPGFAPGVGVGIPIGMGLPQGPMRDNERTPAQEERDYKRYVLGIEPRRKMNPLNPKALRRALRRTEGFEKFAKRTVNALYRVIDGRKVRTFKKRTR